ASVRTPRVWPLPARPSPRAARKHRSVVSGATQSGLRRLVSRFRSSPEFAARSDANATLVKIRLAIAPVCRSKRGMQRFQHNGIEIAFLDEGEGAPIVLVHGFASNTQVNWVYPGWVTTLTRAGRRVIALDNRGHGESSKLYDPAAYH